MSGDLKEPSKAIPKGTLWATLTTFIVYLVVILSMAASIAHKSLATNPDVIALVNISQPVILAGECAVSLFSSLMGVIGSAKLFQALARDRLVPGLSIFGKGTRKSDEPLRAIFLTYAIAQIALLADLNSIATFIAMGYQVMQMVLVVERS
jgi:solute carrier family 12 (potassium/chloride transporters), member 9